MSKRKTAAAFLALVLALSLTACGDDTAFDSSTQTSSKSEITTTTTAPEKSTTVSSSETTASSQTEKKSASKYTISCGDFSVTVKDVNGTPGWQFGQSAFLEGKVKTIRTGFDDELYTCIIGIVPKSSAESAHKTAADNKEFVEVLSLNYLGRDVWCSKVYRKTESEKFVAGFMLDMPVDEQYNAIVTIDVGGKYSKERFKEPEQEDADFREKEFVKWFAENKDAYKDLSTDPNDYLFIFDALDIE